MLYGLFVAVIFLDQITKYAADWYLAGSKSIAVFPLFNLSLAYNTGVSFSMFNGTNPYALTAISLAVCGFFYWCLLREKDSWTRAGIVLVIAGALGNVIDRILYGYVIDFLDFYIGAYHWPAFNVADSAICLGVFIMIVRMLFVKEKTK